LILWSCGSVVAQTSSGGFGGSSGGSSSGFGGSSNFGGTSGSSSSSSSGFLGGTSPLFPTSPGARSSTSSSSGVGSTSFQGAYYGNPLAVGFPANGTNGVASQYQIPYPIQLSFGKPTYGTLPTVATTVSTGLGATGLATSGLGSISSGSSGLGGTGSTGTASLSTSAFPGASSSGIRRVPPYTTEPDFDLPPRPSASAMQTNLQSIIDRTTQLPSRGDIRVEVKPQVGPGLVNQLVILEGKVRNEKERRLAEAVVRLTPGVYAVSNRLVPQIKKKPPPPVPYP
jgi:hypothetical protein